VDRSSDTEKGWIYGIGRRNATCQQIFRSHRFKTHVGIQSANKR
jgi:hypothetical protein